LLDDSYHAVAFQGRRSGHDGDPDIEEGDAEDSFAPSPIALQLADCGLGCSIGDPDMAVDEEDCDDLNDDVSRTNATAESMASISRRRLDRPILQSYKSTRAPAGNGRGVFSESRREMAAERPCQKKTRRSLSGVPGKKSGNTVAASRVASPTYGFARRSKLIEINTFSALYATNVRY
jgi:hypothetical protein